MNDFISILQNLNDDDIKKELLVLQEERHHYEMRAKVLSPLLLAFRVLNCFLVMIVSITVLSGNIGLLPYLALP